MRAFQNGEFRALRGLDDFARLQFDRFRRPPK